MSAVMTMQELHYRWQQLPPERQIKIHVLVCLVEGGDEVAKELFARCGRNELSDVDALSILDDYIAFNIH